MKKKVVTCFLEHEGKILLLRRSQKVGSYRGKWGAVAGYVEEGETPEETARKEIEEETGIKGARLIKEGEPYEFFDGELGITWVVHPFRFTTDRRDVKLDWEHEEAKWIDPEELRKTDTVPHLVKSWERVARLDFR